MNTHVRDNLLGIQHPVHSENTTITVNNTATETSLFSTPPVIAANAMGTSGWIHTHLFGSFIQNTSTRTMTVRVKFGGVTHISNSLNAASVADAATLPWRMDVEIVNLGSAAVQHVRLLLSAVNPNTNTPDFDRSYGAMAHAFAAGAIATTSSQTLDITVQWSAADVNTTWTKLASRVMLMQG